jgi:uncharacterized damage-inducible protein DinB
MIGAAYARMMAAYNAEMNHRLYAAAERLDDGERRRDRGAFWGSIHGTLNHLLWGDRQWMSRFAGWPPNDRKLADSATLIDDFDALRIARTEADAAIIAWAGGLDDAWFASDLACYSGAAKREMTMPRAPLVAHFFNHQTHHRGQVHAMLTASGEKTGDTDLAFVLPRELYG